MKEAPHFLEPKFKPSYRSVSIVGQMYDQVMSHMPDKKASSSWRLQVGDTNWWPAGWLAGCSGAGCTHRCICGGYPPHTHTRASLTHGHPPKP